MEVSVASCPSRDLFRTDQPVRQTSLDSQLAMPGIGIEPVQADRASRIGIIPGQPQPGALPLSI